MYDYLSSYHYIIAATGDTLKRKLEKIKENLPQKKILTFQEMELSSPKRLLIKLFYTLNKTPLGETECSSSIYYLLAAQASSF